MLSNLLPLLATASALLPATWRLCKNPVGTGLSRSATLSGLFSMFVWLGYSVHQQLWISVVSCALFVPYSVALLAVCVLRGGIADGLKPLYMLVAAVTVSSFLGGATALAIVLGLAPLAELPQIRGVLQGDAPALSTVAYGLVVLRTVPWLPYALEHLDLALGLWIVTCLAVNLTMFVVLATKRGVGPRPVSDPRTPR